MRCVKDGKNNCEALYNDEEENRQIGVQERESPPLNEEIRQALMKSARRRAPGSDGTATELLRFVDERSLRRLQEISVKVCESGYWPEEWSQIFIPLPEKDYLLHCSNCRTIVLLSHASKILLRLRLSIGFCWIERRIIQWRNQQKGINCYIAAL